MAAFSSRGGASASAVRRQCGIGRGTSFERFNMHVTGALLHRRGHHRVHQANDRSLMGYVAQMLSDPHSLRTSQASPASALPVIAGPPHPESPARRPAPVALAVRNDVAHRRHRPRSRADRLAITVVIFGLIFT